MNLSEKGWFKEFVQLKSQQFETNNLEPEHDLYKKLQPSGVLYGYPSVLRDIDSPATFEMDRSTKMKLVLLEGFIQSSIIPSKEVVPEEPEEFIHFLAESIMSFYEHYEPNGEVKDRTFWGLKKSHEEIVESILLDRLNLEPSDNHNFWNVFFNNSLLFLDILFFGEYLSHQDKEIGIAEIRAQRDQIHLLLLKVLAAAAFADKNIDLDEQKMFQQFLSSAQIPTKLGGQVQAIIDNGIELDDIELENIDSWLLKKYILEIAILTIWADKVVNDSESDFINRLAQKLGFSNQELMRSMVAIESFVISNWGSIPFLQEKHNFSSVSEKFIDLMSKALSENEDDLKEKIDQNDNMKRLLALAKEGNLDDEEQIKLRSMLLETLMDLPIFVIVSLPGSFLTLPLLLDILPEKTFPSIIKEA